MKNKRMKIRKKVNNAGMTLIEILVAMALLIVAIIPLSHGFIASIQHSNKAKDMQQTSVLAYTMMENCKAYSFDKVNDLITNDQFMPNADRSVTEVDGNKRTTYFVDVPVYKQGSTTSAQYYDLEMIIEPYDVSTNKSMLLYQNMNKHTDAVFVEDKATDTLTSKTVQQCEMVAYEYAISCIIDEIVDSMPAGYTYTTPSVDDIKQQLSTGLNANMMSVNRNIIVSLDKNADVEQCKIQYGYSFTFHRNFQYPATKPDGTNTTVSVDCTGVADPKSYDFVIFDNTTSGVTMQDVYLLYNPLYNDRGIHYGSDEINFMNTIGRDVNVYLIKQKAEGLAETALIAGERSYDPELGGTGTNKIRLYHNLKVDLSGRNGTLGWDQVVFPSFLEIVDTDPSSGVEYLTSENPKQLMYKVTVAVYPKGSYQDDRGDGTNGMTKAAVSSIEGSFLNW